MLLETLDSAAARGQEPLAELIGFGASGDAFHISRPAPHGVGAALAMRRALRDAGVSAAHVAHVNAHASSTDVGDRLELEAMEEVCRETTLHSFGYRSSPAGPGELSYPRFMQNQYDTPPNHCLQCSYSRSLTSTEAASEPCVTRAGDSLLAHGMCLPPLPPPQEKPLSPQVRIGSRRTADCVAPGQVFGDRLSSGRNLSIVSTKGATGHMLGAAGAVEAAYAAHALHAACSPPGINLTQPDDPSLHSLLRHDSGPTPLPAAGAALCNSFGFGGTNAALLFAPFRGQ